MITIKLLGFEENAICVGLSDGRSLTVPLSYYPTLASATADERCNWHQGASGTGVH